MKQLTELERIKTQIKTKYVISFLESQIRTNNVVNDSEIKKPSLAEVLLQSSTDAMKEAVKIINQITQNDES